MDTTLDELRQKRLRFMGDDSEAVAQAVARDPETTRRQMECERIYRAAIGWIDRFAEHVDRVNALLPVPLEIKLSETFSARYADLITEIDAEWLSEYPDLEVFRAACWRLCQLCQTELKACLEKMREASG